MGDPTKLLLLEAVVETIKKDNLKAVVNEAGDTLLKGLKELQVIYTLYSIHVSQSLYIEHMIVNALVKLYTSWYDDR